MLFVDIHEVFSYFLNIFSMRLKYMRCFRDFL